MDNNTSTQKPDQRLLYELDMACRRLELEIIAAEKQLESVKQRLESLKHDLYVYWGLLIVPVIVFIILNLFTMLPVPSLLFILFVIVKYIILALYVMTFSINVYHLIKATMLFQENKENNIPVELPLPEGTRKGEPIPQEKNYRSEHDKLVRVLTRYYLNQEQLEQLHKKIIANPCQITLAELKIELLQIPYYEDIKPANLFSSAMEKKAKKISFFIISAFVLCFIFLILIEIFA